MDISKVKASLNVTTDSLCGSYNVLYSNLQLNYVPPNIGLNVVLFETDLTVLPDMSSVTSEANAVKAFASVCEHVAFNNALRLLIIELSVLSAEVRR